MQGRPLQVPGGLSQLTEKLAAGLCVSYNQRVERIVCDTRVRFIFNFYPNFDQVERDSIPCFDQVGQNENE